VDKYLTSKLLNYIGIEDSNLHGLSGCDHLAKSFKQKGLTEASASPAESLDKV